jgi:hypothetical protein
MCQNPLYFPSKCSSSAKQAGLALAMDVPYQVPLTMHDPTTQLRKDFVWACFCTAAELMTTYYDTGGHLPILSQLVLQEPYLEVLHWSVSPDEEGELVQHFLICFREGFYVDLILRVIVDPHCKVANLQAHHILGPSSTASTVYKILTRSCPSPSSQFS